MSKIYDS